MKKSIKIGLPGGIQQTIIALSNMVLTSLVAGFGTDVLAAYTAAGRTENIAMMPAMSFGAALSAFSGQNIGAKRPHRVRQGLRATLIISSTISIACTIIFIVFGRYIMNAFTSGTETAVIEYGYKYLVITGVFYIFFSAMFSYAGVIRASGDTFVLMLIALVSQVVIRIPLAYLFANQFGPLGIWWSIPSSWILGWFGNFIYYRSGRWKRRKLIQEYPLITD